MYELVIPDAERRVEKEKNTEIRFENGDVITRGTKVNIDEFDGVTVEIQGFYEVENEEVPTWMPLRVQESSDLGVYGIDMQWRELAERVAYGNAEIVEE